MKFSTWIKEEERRIDEINRGLQRQFRQKNQHVPVGVLKDIEHQRLGNMWRNSQPYMQQNRIPNQTNADTVPQNNSYADTLDMVDTNPQSKRTYVPPGEHDSIGSMMGDERISDITSASWEKKPRVIEVTPASFDARSNQLFQYTRFGFKNFGEVDQERHARAAKFVQERGEKNQPIIVLQLPDGTYSLQEGFHRTMQYLLSGAPREHWFALKSGEPVSSIDISQWKPVRLRAYVGYPDGQRNALDRHPNQLPQPAASALG